MSLNHRELIWQTFSSNYFKPNMIFILCLAIFVWNLVKKKKMLSLFLSKKCMWHRKILMNSYNISYVFKCSLVAQPFAKRRSSFIYKLDFFFFFCSFIPPFWLCSLFELEMVGGRKLLFNFLLVFIVIHCQRHMMGFDIKYHTTHFALNTGNKNSIVTFPKNQSNTTHPLHLAVETWKLISG